MNVIEKILSRQELIDAPPVLIDIGASGELHAKWKKIAKSSICIAFDADSRELAFVEKEDRRFKKLIVFNSLVTDQETNEIEFYLTRSPYCSSSLEPDPDKLSGWLFKPLFDVERKVKVKAIRLMDALKSAKIEGIDWFKTDTQGTDLRLFKSLSDSIRNGVIAAEFEPGIVDVYKGEDKLHEVMRYMEGSGFFMSDFRIHGPQRMRATDLAGFSRVQKRGVEEYLKRSPGWAEVSYLKTMDADNYSGRTYLLTFLFAFIENQFGFAIEVADRAHVATGDPFFQDLKKHAIGRVKRISMGWPRVAVKSVANRFLKYL